MSTYRAYHKNGYPITPAIAGVLDNVALTGVATSNGSNVITVASTTGLYPYMGLAINNVPHGAFIRAIKSSTEIIASYPSYNATTGVWSISDANASATATGMLGQALAANPVPIPEAQAPGDTYRNRITGRSSNLKLTGSISGGTDFVGADLIVGGAVPADAATITPANNGSILGLTISGVKAAIDDVHNAIPPRSRSVYTSFFHLVCTGGAVAKIPAGPHVNLVVTG